MTSPLVVESLKSDDITWQYKLKGRYKRPKIFFFSGLILNNSGHGEGGRVKRTRNEKGEERAEKENQSLKNT